MSQDKRADRSAIRITQRGRYSKATQPCYKRMGRLLPTGEVSPAYGVVDRHAVGRLRQWLCRKHKIRTGSMRDTRTNDYGRDEAYPSRSANEQLSVGEGMISSESRMRETRMSV